MARCWSQRAPALSGSDRRSGPPPVRRHLPIRCPLRRPQDQVDAVARTHCTPRLQTRDCRTRICVAGFPSALPVALFSFPPTYLAPVSFLPASFARSFFVLSSFPPLSFLQPS